ncbi:hypothetical protein KUTeg_024685 [Tegillarca granosa]|uniref:Protein YIPF n=1 Tax=Tegillarca granosa TaxID=220873 RepID=A0ABQ9E211_TEGGR|nr:hypothetical protein KUTeg_024685 [Tegillarca granosa]
MTDIPGLKNIVFHPHVPIVRQPEKATKRKYINADRFPLQFAKFDYSEGYTGGENQYMTPSQGYTGTIMTPDTSSYASPASGSDNYEDEPPLMEDNLQKGYTGGENQYMTPSQGYTGTIMTPDTSSYASPASGSDNYEDEPPLMEELGINFDHITQKTMAVLNPFKQTDHTIMQDTDLAGPLVFCLAFGGSLMLSGKLHFGYIYGIGVVGCLAMYFLMNMMSMTGVAVGCIISVLGYCLLPMLFVSALSMHDQQLLVAYPCALVYGVFALLTVF